MPITIDELLKIVEQENQGNDYCVDGILYCYKCDTPKEKRLFWFEWGKSPIKCSCEKAREQDKLRIEYIRTHKK